MWICSQNIPAICDVHAEKSRSLTRDSLTDVYVDLNYTLISLCSSFLVSDRWIDYLESAIRANTKSYDFRLTGRYAFQALSSFCQSTNETLHNSLERFYDTQYVSADLTASDLFREQNEVQIRQFISVTAKMFLVSLKLNLNTTQCNSLLSGTKSNYDLFQPGPPGFGIVIPITYSNCSCATSVSCYYTTAIMNYYGNISLFTVPDFYSGCYIIDALLVSSLQCFYDEQCFNNVTYLVSPTLPLNATALNASASTTFTPNSTVKEMIDQLMVEKWSWNITFAKYYGQCDPSQCTYTVGSRNDAIFIVTTVFGLVGGLVKILKLIIPHLVACCMRLIRKRNGSTASVADERSVPNVDAN